ncbi:E3 ubiquitin-protein ligase RNF126-like [Prunus avium]|uniref:E3 ubiquitin-protein ligase RNF126-like n=1 Tax=Prunus avium TaxID=42229 RepID=A0A6P5RAE1_PRUAV|nr:E3 ubiquitin-protein ligase RNF126-like [Prunus avium]
MTRSTNSNIPAYSPPLLTYHDPYDYFFGINDDIGEWPPSDNFQATQATRTGASDSRRPFEGTLARARAQPLGLAGSAAPPGSRIHILVLGDEMAGQANPWGQIIGNQWNAAAPSRLELDSRLSNTEQKRGLQKLKKEIYKPFRRLSQKVNLYYRDTVVNANEMEKDENGKRCAVCLEDFEPSEEVMLTPCKHMFHEECIVPWVKSNGRCPVCRFAICE